MNTMLGRVVLSLPASLQLGENNSEGKSSRTDTEILLMDAGLSDRAGKREA